MKSITRILGLALCVLAGLSFLRGDYVGKVYFRAADGSRLKSIGGMTASPLRSAASWLRTGEERRPAARASASARDRRSPLSLAREIRKGNLILKRTESDSLAGMEHRRYTQYYEGIEVLGGQVIQHVRRGRVISTTGAYYEGIQVETTPLIDADAAGQIFLGSIAELGFSENETERALVIYPAPGGEARLAYRLTMTRGLGDSRTAFIDARSGEILTEFGNVNCGDLTIGLGMGVHGEQFKLPTTYSNNAYWLADYKQVRPVNQITKDYETYNGTTDTVASDADNIWDSDGALVSVHAYVGLTYDYCYSILGRSGFDGENQKDIVAHVHYPTSGIAVWSSGQMFFDTPAASALDVVAHEYAHGIIDNSSGLLYYCNDTAQPGALNEAFADILGAAVEFHWQPEGEGYDHADWHIGEDIDPAYTGNPYYGASGYLRDLSDPNATTWEYEGTNYPYPCHLSQCLIFDNPASDSGGVHFNSTLYSHAYYLLAAGGTNKVSHLSVAGIGMDSATRIFYRAWTYYMTPAPDYLFAANCLVQSAADLYGTSSNEYAQTIKAMQAIGWTSL